MAERAQLLQQAESIQNNPSHDNELELQDISLRATRQNQPSSSQSYSLLQRNDEADLPCRQVYITESWNLQGSSRQPESTIERMKSGIRNLFQQSARIILRSGKAASHISYEEAPQGLVGSRKYSGWRGGVLFAAISAGTVFFLNSIFTVFALNISKSGTRIGTIKTGNCDMVGNINTWIHIIINLLGTVLLGASNYTMQCISSPTRAQIDVAHEKGHYCDIGIPSIRNLSGWRKKSLFIALAISTLPLQFFWNSAVFTLTQRLDYNIVVVTTSFMTNTTANCQKLYQLENHDDSRYYGKYLEMFVAVKCHEATTLRSKANVGKLTRLSNDECINTYGGYRPNFSTWGDVLLVAKPEVISNYTLLLGFGRENYVSNYTGKDWVCGPGYLLSNNYKCDFKDIAANSNNWKLGPIFKDNDDQFHKHPITEWPIDYCLAEKTELRARCELQYSFIIMLFVVGANSVKFICMIVVLMTQREPVLATVGDCVASFLERPDDLTAQACLMNRTEVRKHRKMHLRLEAASHRQEAPIYSITRRWRHPKLALRWWHGPSCGRLITTLFLCTIAITISIALLREAYETTVSNINSEFFIEPFQMGFGTYNSYATISGLGSLGVGKHDDIFESSSALIKCVTLANLPQVIISCLYFAYNTVYTSMVSADEWSRFTYQKKALRTSMPKGEQRSTYWLSLPWTYALPISAAIATLHWLISQTIFIAREKLLYADGSPRPESYMVVAYSPLAFLTTIIFGSLMVLAMGVIGFKKLKPCVLVGNNSLAIAAACHPPDNDEEAAYRKVGWGAVRHEENGVPGHCTFTSQEVELPREGDWYL